MTIIESLKAETVGRCRERIEQASKKAKKIIGEGQCSRPAANRECSIGNHSVTGALRRRHGL